VADADRPESALPYPARPLDARRLRAEPACNGELTATHEPGRPSLAGGSLTAGAAALVATRAVRRLPDVNATTGGPLILLLENGALWRGERRLFPPGPDRRLAWQRIGTAPGSGPDDVASGRLQLAPAGNVYAVAVTERLSDGFESRVAVRSATADATLYSGTDNVFAPATVWRGDDPGAPAWLLAEQAIRDAEWEADLAEFPDHPRPIVEGLFADVSTDGEADPAGWTAAGALRIAGRTRPQFRLGDSYWAGDTLEPWWAVAAPGPSGAWRLVASGHGEFPDPWRAAPLPAPALAVTVDTAGNLRVDGVIQARPMAEADVIAVDGPFA